MGPVSSREFKDGLGGLNAEAIMKGNPQAIVGAINEGANLLKDILGDKQTKKKLINLAKGLTALSFALPIATLALDIFIGKQQEEPHPVLLEISNKIDSLSSKVEEYQMENK